MSELQKHQYIGDGVYVCHDGYQLWLYTQQGNRIALDVSVMESLIRYYKETLSNETQQEKD